jgi:hypothetical protein
MIWVIEYLLMGYAILDFTLQVVGQMSIFEVHGALKVYGFRKVWSYDQEKQNAKDVFSFKH